MLYIIKYLSDFSLCIAIIELISTLFGYEKIQNKILRYTSAALCSAIPMLFLIPNALMSPLLRIGILLFMMISEALCYSAVFGRLELKMLYISVLSFVTSENYNTLMKIFTNDKIIIMIAASFFEAALLFIINFLIKRKKQEEYVKNCVKLVPKSMYILLIIFLYMMSLYEYVSIMNESISRIMTFPVIVMIVFIVAKLIKVSVSAHEYEHISELLSVQIEKQIDYYCKVTEIYNELRCFRHDLDNHLICLRKLVSESSMEQALSYMDGMNDMCRPLREYYDTGNIIADAILNDKSSRARSSGTEIVFNGFVPTIGILNTDLCTIFSNVLDNAVEACEKDDKALKKKITIDSEFSQGYYFLTISNPVFEKVRIEKNGKIKTSKEDKMLHGLGIANVIKAVKKYDGTSSFNVNDNTFIFHAELKLKDNDC